MILGQVNGMLRFDQIGPGDHHLRAANIDSSLDDILLIILMRLLAVVDALKNGISKIDADL